jgi:hypothetical protein
MAGWTLAALIAVAAMQALTQQDEGPILLPKKPLAKSADATLLVMCDLACNWKLDGEAKGHIQAGGSAKANVVLGQHIVAAATLDGLDKAENEIEVKTAVQLIVRPALQPVRDARLKAEQESAAQDEANGIWTDTATGLTWAKKDNGSNVNWQQATEYCRNLQLAGHSGWRLPTIDELQGIYDQNANTGGFQVKGNLQLSGWHWSSSQRSASGEAWGFIFAGNGIRHSHPLNFTPHERALCVRRSGE